MASSTDLLSACRNDRASWSDLIAYCPTARSDDANRENRYEVLLALHAYHHPPVHADEDEDLVAYIVDEETKIHRAADSYSSSISLACYLLARYKRARNFWPIWAARYSNFDASKCVEVHFMYHSCGGMAGTKAYLENCPLADVLEGAAKDSARLEWWRDQAEETEEDERDDGVVLQAVKKEALDRLQHDEKYGITDEKIEMFMQSNLRTDTEEWRSSLLPIGAH